MRAGLLILVGLTLGACTPAGVPGHTATDGTSPTTVASASSDASSPDTAAAASPNPTPSRQPAPPLVKDWPGVTQDGITMTGRIEHVDVSPDAAIGSAPAIAIAISMTGLEPGARVTLAARGAYDFPVFGCGIQPSPCVPGSDTTDPSVHLCRPAYEVRDVSGTATDTVQADADANGTATATVRLIARESLEACPADPALPWYELSGAWTKIRVTDAEHGLRLRADDLFHGP
jgi:hypothetical protein